MSGLVPEHVLILGNQHVSPGVPLTELEVFLNQRPPFPTANHFLELEQRFACLDPRIKHGRRARKELLLRSKATVIFTLDSFYQGEHFSLLAWNGRGDLRSGCA